MAKWHYVCSITAALTAGGAGAQNSGPPILNIDATARTGDDTRPVHLRFFCSSNKGPNVTGVLSVALDVPRYEQLRPTFDFDPFEGPDATAGALTSLEASRVRSKATGRFAASGSVQGTGAAESFALEVNVSRREAGPLRKLGSVLRPLFDGPGRLVWRQGNAKAGGTPMVVSVDLTQAQADQLKAAIGPCLNGL